MAGFRSPLDAYREDLSRANDRTRFGLSDEFWIILASGLRRIAHEQGVGRPASARRLANNLLALGKELARSPDPSEAPDEAARAAIAARAGDVADALARFPEPEDAWLLVMHVRATAADAEEAGAVELAREILTDLRDLTAHAQPLDQGVILIQLARIARSVGELDTAHDLLQAVGDLARATGTPELETRRAAAAGVLAQTRGNYPAARRHFEAALEGATAMELEDVLGFAHQGLMIVAAQAGDLNAAIHHGWLAVSAARTEGAREAEALNNLAHLCMEAGYPAAALGGFITALGLTSAPRIRLPVLAGVATAAGRLRDARRVRLAADAIDREASDAFPFETSSALLAVARAERAAGNSAAGDAAATRAAAIAHAHGFFEIAHYLHHEEQAVPTPLAEAGRQVVQSLETWFNDPATESRLSYTSTA
jgi:tetratricopeptide (TPR) repeat protein